MLNRFKIDKNLNFFYNTYVDVSRITNNNLNAVKSSPYFFFKDCISFQFYFLFNYFWFLAGKMIFVCISYENHRYGKKRGNEKSVYDVKERIQ